MENVELSPCSYVIAFFEVIDCSMRSYIVVTRVFSYALMIVYSHACMYDGALVQDQNVCSYALMYVCSHKAMYGIALVCVHVLACSLTCMKNVHRL